MEVIYSTISKCNRNKFIFSDKLIAFFPKVSKSYFETYNSEYEYIVYILASCTIRYNRYYFMQPIFGTKAVNYFEAGKFNLLAAPAGFHSYAFDSMYEFAQALVEYEKLGYITEEEMIKLFKDE